MKKIQFTTIIDETNKDCNIFILLISLKFIIACEKYWKYICKLYIIIKNDNAQKIYLYIFFKNDMDIINIINETKQIKALHNLIKNNGQNFNISIEEERLAHNLAS